MSTNSSLAVVILAAGQGKRMGNPNLAKVLTPLDGQPLLGYVLKSTKTLSPEAVVVIVGHQRDTVSEYIVGTLPSARCVTQEQQLGTGHAVQQTAPYLKDFVGDVLILSGDVPLLSESTLKALVKSHRSTGAVLTVLTTDLPDPTGYGRVVVGENEALKKIVEHKDANEEELLITEINSGIYLVRCADLFDSLERVENANAQDEYYLTDIAGILSEQGKKVCVFRTADWREVQGINTPADLAQASGINAQKASA